MTNWLPISKTATFEEGYDLAVKLSQRAARVTQSNAEARDRLRTDYAEGYGALIAGSQVIATQCATVAAAHDFGRDRP